MSTCSLQDFARIFHEVNESGDGNADQMDFDEFSDVLVHLAINSYLVGSSSRVGLVLESSGIASSIQAPKRELTPNAIAHELRQLLEHMDGTEGAHTVRNSKEHLSSARSLSFKCPDAEERTLDASRSYISAGRLW